MVRGERSTAFAQTCSPSYLHARIAVETVTVQWTPDTISFADQIELGITRIAGNVGAERSIGRRRLNYPTVH